MMGVAVVVWLWVVVLICVRDNSLVVGGLCPRHPVPGGLRFRAIPRWVRAVFAVKQAVIPARLLRPSPAPATRAIIAALGGIILTASGLASGVLVGYVVHLLLTAVVLTGV
jgi:flagellar biosynthesis protein FliR